MPDEQAARAQVHGVVGEHEADALVLGERTAEGLAGAGVGRGHIVGTAGGAEPAHAVGEAGGGEPDLGVAEALAELAEDGGGGQAKALDAQHGVAAWEALVEAIHLADEMDAGRWQIGEEHGGGAVLASGHDDREGGAVSAGGEPFLAVQQIVLAVADCRGREGGGIGAGAGRRFGHGETGAGLSLG